MLLLIRDCLATSIPFPSPGVLLNVALPSWLLNILLLALLMLLVSQAVAKGRSLWVQETKRAQAAAEVAACHEIDAELLSANARAADLANANGTGIREALLVGGHHCALTHPALTGAASAGLPSLRIHHGHSYTCPRVPWGLEHDQDATYNYPESLENHVAVAVSRDQVRRSRGVSGGGSSVGAARRRTDDAIWDCMDGVNPAGDDDANCETPSSGVSMPPSAFPFAIHRVPSSNGADEVSGAGHLRSGLLGASPRGQSPASSIYAASWKAFNELGALEFETDLEGDSDFEGAGTAGSVVGRHMRSTRTSGFGSGTASPVLFPPSSYILSQLPRRLLPAHMQLSSATRSPHNALGRRTTRRRSFDQATGADLPAAAAAVIDEETVTAGGDSWLHRRSKWRSRAGHHYGDGGGDTDGAGTGLDEPLLGPQGEVPDRPHGAIPDPRADYSGGGAAAAGTAAAAGGDPGGGGFTAADPYRPTLRLATLHEESDDRVEGGTSGDGAGPQPAPAAPELPLQFPRTVVSTTAACPAQLHALPTSQPAADWDPLQLPCQQPAEAGSVILCDMHNGNGFLGGDVAADAVVLTRSSGRPIGYVYIECMSEVGPERRHMSGWCCAGMSVSAVIREWADGWATTFRRIPRRFAGCLVGAWVVYLALQGARGFQRKCSPAYWTLFAIQTVSMLAVSGGAMVMATTALSKHAEAAETSNGGVRVEGREGAPGGGEDRNGSAHRRQQQQQHGHVEEKESHRGGRGLPAAVAVEPALQCTAAMLVLKAPLSAFLATFGAGLTGGLLGLGGGMVMGPVLLQIGVQPQVTAASSGTMVLFSSSAALIQFAMLHRLNMPYAGAFAAASLAAGLVGTHVVAGAIKRSGRPSIVVLALAGVMAIALVCVAAFGLRQAAEQLRTGDLGFGGICTIAGGK
ncbi:hypothetical protein VaNZ11_011683 [Volvox africanus]|uniref:Uncharacterized protein n=1 Tax=Volvox africanus TaxID=51714 RepID=A0ABQ5SC77_9CHLO|nr:hypothetical protein VaNZ11_011683 [Volvox africanus]